MWKLIIKQFKPTDYGYDREEQVEFVSDDVSKLSRIIDYFVNMTEVETAYTIVREEKKDE